MRLDKYVAGAAQQSRSDVRRAIQKGLVCVNGAVCRSADAQVPAGAAVTLNGQPLVLQQYVYIMLDKPKGVVSAAADKNDVTVVDLVGRAYPRRSLFPAGRLDKTSTGFVLVTDDGAFAHDILAPRRHVPKTYEVLLDTPLTPEMAAGFAAGVRLADGQRLQPAELSPGPDGPCSARVVLRQGVYHQIKRMFGVYGAGVNELRRTAIGGLALDAALGLAVAGILLTLPFAARPLRFLMGNRVMGWLAAVSMNYYLLHQNLAVHLKRLGVPPSVSAEPNRAGEQPWQLQYTLLCFGMSLLGAALITLLIEKPCAKMLKKMFARGKAENKA